MPPKGTEVDPEECPSALDWGLMVDEESTDQRDTVPAPPPDKPEESSR